MITWIKSLFQKEKKWKYAIPPENCNPGCTPGKKYLIKSWVARDGFCIADDHGHPWYCLRTGCAHLYGPCYDWSFSD